MQSLAFLSLALCHLPKFFKLTMLLMLTMIMTTMMVMMMAMMMAKVTLHINHASKGRGGGEVEEVVIVIRSALGDGEVRELMEQATMQFIK